MLVVATRRSRLSVGVTRFLVLASVVLAASLSVAAAPASAASTSPPFVSLGGLNLDAYCQHIGYANSVVNGPINGPNAAYQWYCATATGKTPINLQAACTYQYPGAGAVSYAQDVNDAYSWICVVPKSGTSKSGGTKIAGVNKGKAGSALVVVTSGGESVFETGPAGSVSYEGNDGVSSVLTYEGSGGGSVLTYNGSSGGSVLTYNGSGGGSVLTFNGSNGGSVLTDQPTNGNGVTAVVTYGNSGSLTMLTYDGSSGGSVLTYDGSGGGSVLTYEGSGGGSSV